MLNPEILRNYITKNIAIFSKYADDIRIVDIQKLSGGVTNHVYSFSVEFQEPEKKRLELILKLYSDDFIIERNRTGEEKSRYIREYQTLKKLENAKFPVPHAYLLEVDDRYLGHPFIITSKESVGEQKIDYLPSFARLLSELHNLCIANIQISSLVTPIGSTEFAKECPIRLKQTLLKTKHHYKSLKNNFNRAINWLESNSEAYKCPRYSLIHGEYHPGHVISTSEGSLKVIDWESVDIGDPAFDVGYAYHMVKLMYGDGNSGQEATDTFLAEYRKNCQVPVDDRLEYYKMVSILDVAIEVSSWLSNPIGAYRRFGRKAFVRALAFPLVPLHIVPENWLNSEFLIYLLQYSQKYIKKTLSD